MRISVRVPAEGNVTGRNGTIDIKELSVWSGREDWVYVEGIGRRGRPINGGFYVTVGTLLNLCLAVFAEIEEQQRAEGD